MDPHHVKFKRADHPIIGVNRISNDWIIRVKERKFTYFTRYYPRSVQAEDGRIYIFAHVGSDNPYGSVDQSIVMDAFRLAER